MNPTHPRRPRVKLIRNAVSELLNLLNMTQTELAQMCGLSPGYFPLLMAGKRSPSPEGRRRIQEALAHPQPSHRPGDRRPRLPQSRNRLPAPGCRPGGPRPAVAGGT